MVQAVMSFGKSEVTMQPEHKKAEPQWLWSRQHCFTQTSQLVGEMSEMKLDIRKHPFAASFLTFRNSQILHPHCIFREDVLFIIVRFDLK